MKVSFNRLAAVIIAWFALFAALSLAHFDPFGLLNIVGFSFMLLVPGYLAVLLLGLGKQPVAMKLLLAVAMSLGIFMAASFLGNEFLPFAHIDRPLDKLVLLTELGVTVTCLLGLLWKRSRNSSVMDKWDIHLPSKLDLVFTFAPAIAVVLSVMGALSLNNGGSNIFTVIMLIGVAAYLAAMLFYAKRLSTNTILVGLFFVGLSLLFMTSLRGWYITGHDIQHEFMLFLQTADAGKWAMGVAKDAYNACLSITLLPTLMYNLLDVQSFYVFKILFQIIFALSPGMVFLISQKFVDKRIALIATIYFISFPTFFNDMPMLNRQEIGLMFAGVGLLVLFSGDISLRLKRWLFVFLAAMVIVSHYSTNYTMLALICVTAFGLPLLRLLSNKLKPTGRIYRSANLEIWKDRGTRVITIPIAVLLLAASFFWSVQLTDTSSQLVKVFFDTVQHIQIAIGNDARKQDDYFSYSTVSKLDEQGKLNRYFEQLSALRHGAESDYYNPQTYQKYKLEVVRAEPVKRTGLGESLARLGIRVDVFNSSLRVLLTKFLQIMLLIGALLLFFSKRYNKLFSQDFKMVQIGGLALIAMMLILPVLMADYDLSRMMQQLLMTTGVVIAIASIDIIPRVSHRVRLRVASMIVLLMFVSMTGIFTATFGSYDAQLNLYNSGTYYNLFYTHKEDQIGAQWVEQLVNGRSDVRVQVDNVFVDRYTYVKVQNVVQLDQSNDIYPGLVRKDSYVFLGYATNTRQEATVYYNGSLVTYKYPIQFMDDNKNLLYDNGGARVYR